MELEINLNLFIRLSQGKNNNFYHVFFFTKGIDNSLLQVHFHLVAFNINKMSVTKLYDNSNWCVRSQNFMLPPLSRCGDEMDKTRVRGLK